MSLSVNAQGFCGLRASPVAPGGAISITGSNLAAASASSDTLPDPTVLGGTQVLLGGTALQDKSGKGAGWIAVVNDDGSQTTVTNGSPAAAGNTVAIFCAGLGAVDQVVADGSAAPDSRATERG